MVEFERLETSFKKSAFASVERWVIDGSVLRKNGKVFADLAKVDHIALGHISNRGSSSERIVFSGPDGSKTLSFSSGWKQGRNDDFAELKRTILIRFGHYRPDGVVDPKGEKQARYFSLIFGLLLIAGGSWAIAFSVLSLDNGSEFSQMPLAVRAVFATSLIGSGLLFLRNTIGRPVSAKEYGEALTAVASPEGVDVRAPEFNMAVFGIWVVASAVAFASVFYGRLLVGDERVQILDAGMEPQFAEGDREWADLGFESIDKFDVVAIDTTSFDRPDLPPVIVRRVAAVGGQTVSGQDGLLLVDRFRYLVGSETSVDNNWSVEVPLGHVFLMADNRSAGNDSRDLGTVPLDAIVGVLSKGRP